MRKAKSVLTRIYGELILATSSIMFANSALADDWDKSTNATATQVVNNIKDTAQTVKNDSLTVIEVAGIFVFGFSVYRIYQIKVKHENASIGTACLGAVIGVVLFFAPYFMSIGKNTLVGR